MHIIGGMIQGLSGVQELKPIYDKKTSVIAGLETTIVSYVVPTAKTFFIQSVIASGKGDGEFKLLINGEQKLYGRTSSSDRTHKNIFGGAVGIKCVATDLIQLTVTHWELSSQDFEGTIAGFLNEA